MPDARALAELRVRGLEHSFIRQGAGAGHDAHRALLVNEARHDADLAFVRRDDARAIRPDEPRARAGKRRLHAHHVVHRHTFGDAHHELDARIRRFENGVRRARRRHVDHAGRRTGFAYCVLHGVEHGLAEMRLATTPRRYAANELGAVRETLLRVIRALLSRESLTDDLGIAIDQNAHARPFSAEATTVRAASVRSAAAVIVSPLPASISRALRRIRSFQPHHHRHLHADLLHGGDDAVRNDVAADDAAENVHEDRTHLRVGQDQLERHGHPLARRAAAHVQEVRRLPRRAA